MYVGMGRLQILARPERLTWSGWGVSKGDVTGGVIVWKKCIGVLDAFVGDKEDSY